MMFALWFSTSHVPINCKGPIQKTSHLRVIYLSWVMCSQVSGSKDGVGLRYVRHLKDMWTQEIKLRVQNLLTILSSPINDMQNPYNKLHFVHAFYVVYIYTCIFISKNKNKIEVVPKTQREEQNHPLGVCVVISHVKGEESPILSTSLRIMLLTNSTSRVAWFCSLLIDSARFGVTSFVGHANVRFYPLKMWMFYNVQRTNLTFVGKNGIYNNSYSICIISNSKWH